MNRRLFIEHSLRASLLAISSALGGCKIPGGSMTSYLGRLSRQPSARNNTNHSSGQTPGTISRSTSQPFPPASQPQAKSQMPTAPAGAINVRDYGARGDGVANDTDAFHAASQAIEKAGGGTLWIPTGTYIVGKQDSPGTNVTSPYYTSRPIIKISHCQNPVIIQGELGSILKSASGLRYGSFEPASGQAYTPSSMPFTNAAYQASGPGVFIDLSKNVDVTVESLELDGNIKGLVLGGQWGDTGRQLPAIGVRALDSGKLTVKNLYTHHHGQDGLLVGHYSVTTASAATPVLLESVVSEYNARQGLSWIGGNGVTANNCKFNHTGKARFSSSPGAGLDIEAENSICRNGVFNNCEFTDNTGCCIVADSGDSANITFNNCTVWGITNWSVWPRKPDMVFKGCDIHGAMVQVYSDPSGTACQFINCTIDDGTHPTLGPSHIEAPNNILIDMGGVSGAGVVFDGCTITSVRGMSFYTKATPEQPITIRNSTLIHGFAGHQRINSLTLLVGAYLENVHFKDGFASPPTGPVGGLNIRRSVVGPDVYVDGPLVKWPWPPHTGLIPQGPTPD